MTSQQHSKHPDWDELWEKVHNKDQSWLREYIKSHDINRCLDEQGNTLVHCAVQNDDVGAFPWLDILLIDSNIKNAAGQTALQLASDTECLGMLHQHHLCIDFDKASLEPNGLDALLAAIYRGDATLGDTSGVKNDGNEENEGGWTALHCAVMYDRPQLIRELHQRFPKLDADLFNRNYCSVLSLAAKYGHSNCIIALSECFPTIDIDDILQTVIEYNRSACVFAMQKCFPHLTGNELDLDSNLPSALMCAVLYNNPECIRALHSCFPDIDPNLQDGFGQTALINDMLSPTSPNCTPTLFECFPNIDPNKQDTLFGNTALMYAVQRGLSQSVTLLATYFPSIDVNIRNEDGNTALMIASDKGDENCIAALSQSFLDIDPNLQDNNGNTALMHAICLDNNERIISQLHKLFPNIDPNIQNTDGETALMLTSKSPNDSVESMCQLLDTFPNIDATIQTAKSDTALTIAIKHGNASLVAFLLKRFPNIVFPQHTALLMLAIKENHLDVISVFLKYIVEIYKD